jgi:RNA polymerase sigma-70 factor, ECF subfamily
MVSRRTRRVAVFPTGAVGRESTDCVTRTEPETSDDVELVRLARGGDADAFGTLLERNRRAVYRAAYAALGSPSDADDVVQEAFVIAYRKLSSFRGESSFKTWLLSIAWRKALDRRRSITRWLRMTVTQHNDPFEGPTDALDRVPSAQPSHEERLAADDMHRAVKRLIASLPRKLRDALLLAGSGEHSYHDIGTMLGIPVGTVKWRVSEARRILKAKLTALGYAHD